MASSKIVLLGGAAALLFLVSGKKAKASSSSSGTTSKTDTKPKEAEESKPGPTDDEDKPKEEPKEEPVEEQDDVPAPKQDLPEVKDEDIKIPQNEDGENNDFKLHFDKFYKQWVQQNNEQPADPNIKTLWISKTCLSWAIGKEWYPYLPAKLVFWPEELKNHGLDPDKFILPTTYIDLTESITPTTPDPIYVFDLPGDTLYYSWTRNIIDLQSGCGATIPARKNYTNFKAYHTALMDFVKNTSIGKLFWYLSENIRTTTYEYWAQKYPQAAEEEVMKGYALQSVRSYPKYSATDQTDEAYKAYFAEDPNAPKKINSKLASHQPYKKAWTNLNQYVKKYRDLISKWG